MRLDRPRLLMVLAGFGLFFFFLLFLFPFQNLKGYIFTQIHKNTGIVLSAEDLYLSLFGWPGVGMRGVEVTIPVQGGEIVVACRKLVARVGLGSLFPPAPSFSLDMSELRGGGNLYVRLSRGGSFFKGVIDADKVALNEIKISTFPQAIEGTATVAGDFYFDEAQLPQSSGELTLKLSKFKFPALNLQGFILPGFDLGTVVSEIQIRNGKIGIVKSQIGVPGGDFQGKLAGELRLSKTFLESFLDLKVFVQLSQKYIQDPNNATVVSFLSSFQRAPGDFGMKWSSTLQGMTTNLLNALPQKTLD